MAERFEDQLLGALVGEVQSPEGPHLTRREVRRLLRGRTRVADMERLGGHLASCSECRASYDAARRNMEARPRSPATLRPHPSAGWTLILLRYVGVLALALSVVAISIAIGRKPEVREPVASPAYGARGAAVEAQPTLQKTPLDAQTLVRSLQEFSGYPANRAAAFTIGLLRQYGVPLSSETLAFEAATIYVTRPGDTWESVAAQAFGDATLWPIVVLMNLEKTEDGEFVTAGTYLYVPKTISLEGSE